MLPNLNPTTARRLAVRFVMSNLILWVALIFCFPTASAIADVFVQMAKIQNDSSAQYFLGRRYLRGHGVLKSETEAANWFLKAARQGHKKAQYELGLLYKNGKGVKKNNQTAFEHFLGAAQQEHPGAMFELGNFYFYGPNKSRNIKRALSWYRKSANKKYGDAQYQLGKILKEGIGVKANRKEGQKWLDIARANGAAGAGYPITEIDKPQPSVRSSVPASVRASIRASDKQDNKKKPPPPKINTKLLDDIRKEGVDTQFSIGMSYLNGNGRNIQPKVAAQWLREAARNDHAGAQFELGKMYRGGIGVEKSDGEAIKWFRKANSWGFLKAKTMLNQLMEEQLVNYIKESPAGPDIRRPELQFKVGTLYLEGKGFKKNPIKAANWIIKAARNKYPQAQYEAGKMYKNGIGFVQDLVRAKYWFEQAAENGNTDANRALASLTAAKQIINGKQSLPQPLLTEAQSGDPSKQYNAAMTLLNKGKEAKTSIQWFTLAANQGHINAQKQLATIFSNGKVIERDLFTAATWLKMAAEAGDADSQYALADMYKKGLGVDKSNSLAVKWYRVAARQGHRSARGKLGCQIC